MNRRTLLALLSLGALSPALARQQKNIPKVGILFAGTFALRPQIEGFFQELKTLGYVEGKSIAFEKRESEGKYERLAPLAKELVALRPDVILAHTTSAALALQKATTTIPIVIVFVGDPVGSGLAQSLSRPGGNITGCSNNPRELTRKRVQLLKDLVPTLSRIAILWNSDAVLSVAMAQEAHLGAKNLGLQIDSLDFKGLVGLQATLAKPVRAQGLLVVTDPLLSDQRAVVASFAAAHRMAAIGMFAEEAQAGMLASYGESYWNGFRRSAPYVDKLLRGAKPSDLPIEDPTKYDFVINLKTAKSIGMSIPQSMKLRADEVIE